MIRVLVTGASGQLGAYLLQEVRGQNGDAVAWSATRRGELFGYELHPVDLADPVTVAAAFRAARPDAIIHAGALARIDVCQRDPKRANCINVQATAQLAELANRAGIGFVFVSTDLVSTDSRRYRESGRLALSIYSKTSGSRADRADDTRAL